MRTSKMEKSNSPLGSERIGIVYDLDYTPLYNAFQVLIDNGNIEPPLYVSSQQLLMVLEVSFQLKVKIQAHFRFVDEQRFIDEVIIENSPPSNFPQEYHYITKLKIDKYEVCNIEFKGTYPKGYTKDLRLISLMLLSLRTKLPIEKLHVEKNLEITGGKVNSQTIP